MTAHAALIEQVPRQRATWPEWNVRSGVGTLDARLAPVHAGGQTVSAPPGVPRHGVFTGYDSAPTAILVVEADAVIGKALVEQLAADGFHAELARTAEHARALAAERVPKLAVIGDLDSPRGGLELLGEIREADRKRTPWTHELPVIVVSSLAQELDMLRAFEAGADDFLARPARYLELRARLRADFMGVPRAESERKSITANSRRQQRASNSIETVCAAHNGDSRDAQQELS